MSETTGTAVKGENVNGNAVRLINDEFWRQDVEPWCEPVNGEEMLDAFRRYVPRSEIDDLRGQTRPVAEEKQEEEEEEE